MSRVMRVGLVIGVMAVSGCTVHETEIPDLTGPSEFGLRIALQAVPDAILQDGMSQTVINIDASNGVDGRPVRGLSMRIDMSVNGQVMDFGTLSAKTVVTGDDGKARVIYQAPPRPVESIGDGNIVTIGVTPIGTDYRSAAARTVDIRLIPPGVIMPPNDAPVAKFTFEPAQPVVMSTVTFDASGSTDDGVQCGVRCSYAWDFGDGSSGSGIFATHQYRAAGSYQVRLTVTDARGASGAVAQTVTIGGGTPPTASFTFSPTNPAVSQTIFFSAEASRAATGRRIVSYDWNFGSGATGSGVTVSKGYNTAGTYNVTLTVTDDAGQQGTATQSVTVGAVGTGPTASLIVSPTSGSTATNFFFDASGSRPGPSPIIEYRFTFGDGTPDVVGSSPTTTHRYTSNGTYTARVTVRDSANRTATTTVSVAVQ